MPDLIMLERRRLELQTELDAAKSHLARNQLGQFATPTQLASEILEYGLSLIPQDAAISFLDPALGTGSFFSALLQCLSERPLKSSIGFEVDPHYGVPAKQLWHHMGLQLELRDFTKASPQSSDLANLLICNPPYVRHHHLESNVKQRLQNLTLEQTGIRLSGLAGLYCYFLLLSQRWMAVSGVAGWLIPCEFMDVNYGDAVKQFLLSRVTLLQIHRFDPSEVQFDDALVSSAVVWIKNIPPPPRHAIRFTFGGSLANPRFEQLVTNDELWIEPKWSRLFAQTTVAETNEGPLLGDLFRIQRGLATGSNEFFVVNTQQVEQHQLPQELLKPILPSPRYMPVDEVLATRSGLPVCDEQLFLLNCDLPEETVREKYPTLWRYLESGIAAGVDQRYLCQHRSPWYSQEQRQPPPLLCTYMGRTNTASGRPFRFILNHSQAVAANVYLLLYPKPKFQRLCQARPQCLRELWAYLNNLPASALTHEGRVYGGGLHKLEPRELANLPVGAAIPQEIIAKATRRTQQALFV